MRPIAPLLIVLCACGPAADGAPTGAVPEGPRLKDVSVADEGLTSGYQDNWFGTWKRGRGNLAADFDGDGDPDVFSGNPGTPSFLIRNTTAGPGAPLGFEPWQVLSDDELFFGGVASDFDNDGDPDLFVAGGANDGPEFDRFWRNDFSDGAPADQPLVDISTEMMLFQTDAAGYPMPNRTMGAMAFDANNDGRMDVWASNEVKNFDQLAELVPEDRFGLNQLYLSEPPGVTLVDHAWELGMTNQAGTRNIAVFDYDRDGDMDVFENNFNGPSVFWRNLLIEEGALRFEDATEAVVLVGGDLAGPFQDQAMCAIASDLDNDGWEDLVVLNRGLPEPIPEGAAPGHQVWMNVQGRGFVEVTGHTGLSTSWSAPLTTEATATEDMAWWGVMGCQVGDFDLDGFPDFFFGNGGGAAGETNQLLVASERTRVELDGVGTVAVPQFDDWSSLIDFPPPSASHDPLRPVPYPLRTHGSTFVDFDGDGVDELAVHNGGPAARDFLEPNRLYRSHLPDPRFLRVTVRGDGVAVTSDAAGTRVRAVVERDRDGGTWELWRVKHLATGFGAQNGEELVFGLGDGDRVVELEVLWPDGSSAMVDPPRGAQNWLAVER